MGGAYRTALVYRFGFLFEIRPGLEEVALEKPGLTDWGELPDLPEVQSLRMADNPMQARLGEMPPLPAVQELTLQGEVSRPLPDFREWKALRTVILESTSICDFRPLLHAPALKRLALKGTQPEGTSPIICEAIKIDEAGREKVWNPEGGSVTQPGVAPHRRYPG